MCLLLASPFSSTNSVFFFTQDKKRKEDGEPDLSFFLWSFHGNNKFVVFVTFLAHVPATRRLLPPSFLKESIMLPVVVLLSRWWNAWCGFCLTIFFFFLDDWSCGKRDFWPVFHFDFFSFFFSKDNFISFSAQKNCDNFVLIFHNPGSQSNEGNGVELLGWVLPNLLWEANSHPLHQRLNVPLWDGGWDLFDRTPGWCLNGDLSLDDFWGHLEYEFQPMRLVPNKVHFVVIGEEKRLQDWLGHRLTLLDGKSALGSHRNFEVLEGCAAQVIIWLSILHRLWSLIVFPFRALPSLSLGAPSNYDWSCEDFVWQLSERILNLELPMESHTDWEAGKQQKEFACEQKPSLGWEQQQQKAEVGE